MTTNSELLKIAKKYLGRNGSTFRKFCGLGAKAPYCNAYVCYVANKGGVSKLYFDGKKETYCPHSYEWCKKNLAQVPPYLSMPMDIIYFDWQPNGVPDHIGFVREKKDTNSVYTIEGNTSKIVKGKTVARNVVAERTRAGKNVQAIFRPKFSPPNKLKKKKIDTDGDFGWFSIYNLQLALGLKGTGILDRATVMALQKKSGADQDAWWGVKTSKRIQKMIGVKQDGKFGKKSVKKLQSWINAKNYPAKKSTKTKATTTKKTTTTKKKTTTTKKTVGKKGGADIPYSKFKPGDIAICYDKNGKFHHVVLITDKNRYIDCTNTSKQHIHERDYSVIKKKYHVTRAFRPTDPKLGLLAVAWARKIAKNGGYTYKKWKNNDKKTKLCPICNPKLKGKYKGWNCIGFVTAAYYHGAKLKTIKCSCSGLGTDGFFTKVTLASWKKRNGNNWTIVTN